MWLAKRLSLASLIPGLPCLAASALCLLTVATVSAGNSLRLDYILSGRSGEHPEIALRGVSRLSTDNTRHVNMQRPALGGNGSITVTNVAGDTLYSNTFSTLFQEWMELGDTVRRSFEATFAIPESEEPVDVTLALLDNHHRQVATHRLRLDNTDILIRTLPRAPYSVDTLHRATWPTPIRVAILGEGYREDESAKFVSRARQAVSAILRHEPFATYADRFEFVAVTVPSVDSGVSIPKLGEWRDTPFGAHFSTFYSDRYLTTPRVFALHDALSGVNYEHIIVLANTEEYGGGGIYNSYTLTAADHPLFEPVVVHEFGHSFGGLGDEYFYEQDAMNDTYALDVEPWEQNITTLVDFGSKWADMVCADTPVPTPVDKNVIDDFVTVGVYEGAGYSTRGIYRPADWCRMRANRIAGFCPVCRRALSRVIRHLTE